MNARASARNVSISAMAALVACATPGSGVVVQSQATGTGAFSLSKPIVREVKGGLMLSGSACRRARSTLLSPPRVRLEHVSPAGGVIDSGRAYLPTIYRRADQRCSHYSLAVAWRLAEGDTVRACFDRGRPCPAAPSATVVIPAAPSATP